MGNCISWQLTNDERGPPPCSIRRRGRMNAPNASFSHRLMPGGRHYSSLLVKGQGSLMVLICGDGLPPHPLPPSPHTGSDVIVARWRTEEADSAPLHASSRLWHSLISELRPERHVLFLLFKLFTTSLSNTEMRIRPFCFN